MTDMPPTKPMPRKKSLASRLHSANLKKLKTDHEVNKEWEKIAWGNKGTRTTVDGRVVETIPTKDRLKVREAEPTVIDLKVPPPPLIGAPQSQQGPSRSGRRSGPIVNTPRPLGSAGETRRRWTRRRCG